MACNEVLFAIVVMNVLPQVGGNGFFVDVPHLLVWGGEGTRMDADICTMLAKWTPALRKGNRRRGDSGGAVPEQLTSSPAAEHRDM
jgi:hypothetical protein